MPVNLVRVTPGIALSAAEADRLKRQIEAYIEGIGMRTGNYVMPEFTDDRQRKRRISYAVKNINGRTIDVELISMT